MVPTWSPPETESPLSSPWERTTKLAAIGNRRTRSAARPHFRCVPFLSLLPPCLRRSQADPRSMFWSFLSFVFFCFFNFSVRNRFPKLQSLFGTNPSNVPSCFFLLPSRSTVSQDDPVSIPFDSIVLRCVKLRCLLHTQFHIFEETQPSGTIRREPTYNKSTTQHTQ